MAFTEMKIIDVLRYAIQIEQWDEVSAGVDLEMLAETYGRQRRWVYPIKLIKDLRRPTSIVHYLVFEEGKIVKVRLALNDLLPLYSFEKKRWYEVLSRRDANVILGVRVNHVHEGSLGYEPNPRVQTYRIGEVDVCGRSTYSVAGYDEIYLRSREAFGDLGISFGTEAEVKRLDGLTLRDLVAYRYRDLCLGDAAKVDELVKRVISQGVEHFYMGQDKKYYVGFILKGEQIVGCRMILNKDLRLYDFKAKRFYIKKIGQSDVENIWGSGGERLFGKTYLN